MKASSASKSKKGSFSSRFIEALEKAITELKALNTNYQTESKSQERNKIHDLIDIIGQLQATPPKITDTEQNANSLINIFTLFVDPDTEQPKLFIISSQLEYDLFTTVKQLLSAMSKHDLKLLLKSMKVFLPGFIKPILKPLLSKATKDTGYLTQYITSITSNLLDFARTQQYLKNIKQLKEITIDSDKWAQKLHQMSNALFSKGNFTDEIHQLLTEQYEIYIRQKLQRILMLPYTYTNQGIPEQPAYDLIKQALIEEDAYLNSRIYYYNDDLNDNQPFYTILHDFIQWYYRQAHGERAQKDLETRQTITDAITAIKQYLKTNPNPKKQPIFKKLYSQLSTLISDNDVSSAAAGGSPELQSLFQILRAAIQHTQNARVNHQRVIGKSRGLAKMSSGKGGLLLDDLFDRFNQLICTLDLRHETPQRIRDLCYNSTSGRQLYASKGIKQRLEDPQGSLNTFCQSVLQSAQATDSDFETTQQAYHEEQIPTQLAILNEHGGAWHEYVSLLYNLKKTETQLQKHHNFNKLNPGVMQEKYFNDQTRKLQAEINDLKRRVAHAQQYIERLKIDPALPKTMEGLDQDYKALKIQATCRMFLAKRTYRSAAGSKEGHSNEKAGAFKMDMK